MRELKFQAWHKRKKAMFIVHDLILFDEGYGASLYRTLGKKDNAGREEEEYIRRARPSEIIIREYIGLKNKNGKEIYEGDYIKWEIQRGTFIVSEVIFTRGMFGVVSGGLVWGCGNSCSEAGRLGDVESVGNKYENPDLIEEAKP